jgi:DNA polymerase III epsilon subunit-like protein
MEPTKLPTENLKSWFSERVNNTFIFFDTETTGLYRKDNNQLTQIGAIATKFDIDNFVFNEVSRFNINIKLNNDILKHMEGEPEAPDKTDVEAYNKWMFSTKKGILVYNHYNLVNSPEYEDERIALEKFDNYLKKHDNVILIAHNAPFDLSWIQFHEIFQESTYESIDSKEFFSKIFFPSLKKMAEKIEEYRIKYDRFETVRNAKSASLKNVATGFSNDINKLKEKLENAHDAIVDCEITKEVMEYGLQMLFGELPV